MGAWKIASNILGAWADRSSNRNENGTWADKEKIVKIIFSSKKSVARKIFYVLTSFSEEQHRLGSVVASPRLFVYNISFCLNYFIYLFNYIYN